MATTATEYYPYDAGAGANITESQWRSMMGNTTNTGVVAGYLNELAVTGDSTGMQVKLATGGAWIYGAYGANTSGVQTISIAASHATLNRYDLIVARNNYTTNVIEFDVIQGTNAASPTVPTVTIDTTKYEIALAYVYIAATVTTITAANVTDQRAFNNQYNTFTRKFTLVTAGDSIVIDNLPSRKYLKISYLGIATGGTLDCGLRFNSDSGTNYNYIILYYNAGTPAYAGGVSQTLIACEQSSTPTGCIEKGTVEVLNIATQRKIISGTGCNNSGGAASGGNVANIAQATWDNAVSAISRVEYVNTAGTGDFAVGSELIIIGQDVPF